VRDEEGEGEDGGVAGGNIVMVWERCSVARGSEELVVEGAAAGVGTTSYRNKNETCCWPVVAPRIQTGSWRHWPGERTRDEGRCTRPNFQSYGMWGVTADAEVEDSIDEDDEDEVDEDEVDEGNKKTKKPGWETRILML